MNNIINVSRYFDCSLDYLINENDESGVDFAMDVHGDEAIPAVFFAGFEGIPSWNDAQYGKFIAYRDRLAIRTPDFQTEFGYVKAAAGKANLSMSTNQVAERFGATAMTLEMPYKDNPASPEPEQGWSPERCKMLARDCLASLLEWLEERDAKAGGVSGKPERPDSAS